MSKAQFSQGVAHMYIINLSEPHMRYKIIIKQKFYVFAADIV